MLVLSLDYILNFYISKNILAKICATFSTTAQPLTAPQIQRFSIEKQTWMELQTANKIGPLLNQNAEITLSMCVMLVSGMLKI